MSDLQIKLTLGKMDLFPQGDGELVYKVFCDIRENGLGLLDVFSIDENVSNTEEDLESIPENLEINGGQAAAISRVSHKSKKEIQQIIFNY